MGALSIFRVRWKAIVLSLAFVYALYFFVDVNNITDRRDILRNLEEKVRNGTSAASHLVGETMEEVQNAVSGSGEFKKPKGVMKNPPVDPKNDEYIAFCVAVKDQSRDLPEFLMHHYYNMGVGRFYIMDDGSNPPLESFADTYGIPRSALTFDYKPFGDKKIQWMQYALDDRCISEHGKNHSWMAFIDADEFIETKGNDTLRGMLNELDDKPDIGGLGINWRIHTSSGLLERPASARKSYLHCIGDEDANDGTQWMDNKGIKSIVKVPKYKLPMNPHQFYLHDDAKTVGEHGDVLPYGASRTPITRDRIALHHYVNKSKKEFEEKMSRWSAKGWDYWDHIDKYRVIHECPEMAKYEP